MIGNMYSHNTSTVVMGDVLFPVGLSEMQT